MSSIIDLSIKETRPLLSASQKNKELTILERFGEKWMNYGMKFPQAYLTAVNFARMPEAIKVRMDVKAAFMEVAVIHSLWYLQQNGNVRGLSNAFRSIFKQFWITEPELDDLILWYYTYVIDAMEKDIIELEYYEVMAQFKTLKSKVYIIIAKEIKKYRIAKDLAVAQDTRYNFAPLSSDFLDELQD